MMKVLTLPRRVVWLESEPAAAQQIWRDRREKSPRSRDSKDWRRGSAGAPTGAEHCCQDASLAVKSAWLFLKKV